LLENFEVIAYNGQSVMGQRGLVGERWLPKSKSMEDRARDITEYV
jgi:hypothetical protein